MREFALVYMRTGNAVQHEPEHFGSTVCALEPRSA